ncbi:hypothetical protein QNI16_31830 [Cytophagaceae bacterium YF14B1]|uniref:Uncharacterized protein n=1 Tax=Xanthocytophaga flava TaxID=3048013 RepID=A0AAE3UAV7_9BACT|nr:hypothetical protein [Xanthocytophaga flavus]MDJ1485132.1 hypothetical protein [Xanthocytophaga flavus]
MQLVHTPLNYGIHHIKVVTENLKEGKNIRQDTIVIAYVYNNRTERKQYHRNFDLKTGSRYIFTTHLFTPCSSDFPRMQGYCDGHDFYPVSSSLVKKYATIQRIIHIAPFLPNR